ncbi:hypothetical protein A2U01_0060560, partial [Trifolium medium]|nr:hypothetical protein [Trifolium medium]
SFPACSISGEPALCWKLEVVPVLLDLDIDLEEWKKGSMMLCSMEMVRWRHGPIETLLAVGESVLLEAAHTLDLSRLESA